MAFLVSNTKCSVITMIKYLWDCGYVVSYRTQRTDFLWRTNQEAAVLDRDLLGRAPLASMYDVIQTVRLRMSIHNYTT